MYVMRKTVIESPVIAQKNSAEITIQIHNWSSPALNAAPALIIIFERFFSTLGPTSVVAALTVTWNGAAKCANVDVCLFNDASYFIWRRVNQNVMAKSVFSNSGAHG